MAKAFEINLTPQNDEWIKLIPTSSPQNIDIVMNKLIDAAINEGLLLEIISQSLTISDLAKFKTLYSKMQSKRIEYITELEITPTQVERKKVIQSQPIESGIETDIPEELPVKPAPNKGKKVSHGFDESTF